MPHVQPKKQTPLLKGSMKNLFFPPEKNEYEYFSGARTSPFAGGDHVVKAAWAADASMLGYARYGPQRMSDVELGQCLHAGGLTLRKKIGENPANWNAPGTQAFFATADNFAILAFRGTEADDPPDLHDDLELALVPEPDYKSAASPPLGHLSSILHLFSDPCLVHRGFQKALNRVWGQVYEELAQYRRENPAAEICLTGHSLGGALALLTYSRFRDENVSAYTFGCPRVGDAAFRARVAAGGQGHFRFVNFNDVVTHVPPESALYLHAPQDCYRFDDAGWLDMEQDGTLGADLTVFEQLVGGLPADLMGNLKQLDELPAPPGLVDHSPARYCTRLWNCV
jgi:Lipase (class 3)